MKVGIVLAYVLAAASMAGADFQIRLDPGHLSEQPFGVERVGPQITVVVQSSEKPSSDRYVLSARIDGKEVERRAVKFPAAPPLRHSRNFWQPEELVLSASDHPRVLARKAIADEPFEAEAVAKPSRVVNPVDLGAILVPSGWLLLVPGQSATVDFAAIIRPWRDHPEFTTLCAWFGREPEKGVDLPIGFEDGCPRSRLLGAPRGPERR